MPSVNSRGDTRGIGEVTPLVRQKGPIETISVREAQRSLRLGSTLRRQLVHAVSLNSIFERVMPTPTPLI